MQFNPIQYPAALLEPVMISTQSAWVEHIPFAYVLMECLRPRQFVELGVHAGDSYCAFCQGRNALALATNCFGVDTWEGDGQAGTYSQEILTSLRRHHDPRYGTFSKLMQMKFDEAAAQFQDGSIDLLHIDGLHTYQAVRQDFLTWLPKMSERGIVLFHDTNANEVGFGVFQIWAELAAQYPHFHFEHCRGLGVLAVGKEVPAGLQPLFDSTPQDAVVIRNFYARIGREITLRSYYTGVMRNVFQAQSLINQWKQHTQQNILPNSQNIQVALQDPSYFVNNLLRDVQFLATADLNLRQQVQALQNQRSV